MSFSSGAVVVLRRTWAAIRVKLPVQDVTTTPIHVVTGWLGPDRNARPIGHNREE